jgi:hypothetical protein
VAVPECRRPWIGADGGAGCESRTGRSEHPPLRGEVVRNETSFGALFLTLHPRSYTWRFIPTASGSFTDTGTAPATDPHAARPSRQCASLRACVDPVRDSQPIAPRAGVPRPLPLPRARARSASSRQLPSSAHGREPIALHSRRSVAGRGAHLDVPGTPAGGTWSARCSSGRLRPARRGPARSPALPARLSPRGHRRRCPLRWDDARLREWDDAGLRAPSRCHRAPSEQRPIEETAR